MGIKTKNCEEYTTLREMFGRVIPVPHPVSATNNVVASASPPAVGAAHTLVETYLVPTTLIFAMASSTGSVTYLVVGRNQFNEPVQESVTLTGAGAADVKATLHAYLSVSSITVTAKSGSPGAMVVGQDSNNAGAALSIGLPFKVKNATDVAAIKSYNGAGFDGSPTVSATYHTAEMTTNIGVAVNSVTFVFLAPHAQLKY